MHSLGSPHPAAASKSSLFVKDWRAGLVLLVLAVSLVYWPALRGGFIWDDDQHVSQGSLQTWAGLGRIWTEPGATPQYYPLLHSLFWVEGHLWGSSAFGYHLTNVLLHLAACFLLWRVLVRLEIPGAGIAAAIFALHPAQVETVAWVSEQKNLLSGVFYFAGALAYLHYDEIRRPRHYALALLLFILALLSKTVTATLPAALLVVLWWKRGTLSWRRDFVPLAPWLAIGIAAGLLTAWVEQHLIGAAGADYDLSFAQRFIVAGRALLFYLEKIFWPAQLTFIYPRWPTAGLSPAAFLYPAAALLITAGLWLGRRRGRGPLAGWLYFAGTLFPALGFVSAYPFQFSFVADHFQYLACLGIIVPVAAGLAALQTFAPGDGRTVTGLYLAGLGLLAWSQAAHYRSSLEIYRATLARNPGAWMAANNLGAGLAAQGRFPEALALYDTALQLRPQFAGAHFNRANALFYSGQGASAIAEYLSALRQQPDAPLIHNNLAFALASAGRPDLAEAHYREALRLGPHLAEVHFNLGTLYLNQGQPAQAITQLELALKADPLSLQAENNLGLALLKVNRADEAAQHFQHVLELSPDLPVAHFNLGRARALQGRLSDAQRELETAIRLDPHLDDARQVLENLRPHLPAPSGTTH